MARLSSDNSSEDPMASTAVSASVIDMLREMRSPPEDVAIPKRRRVNTEPGKGITVDCTQQEKVTTPRQTPNRGRKYHQATQEDSRSTNGTSWKGFVDLLKSVRTFNEIELLVQEHGGDLLQHKVIEYTGRESIITSKSKIDAHAMSCMPSDIPSGMYPVETVADGNCFPRTLSKLVFGTEEHHLEVRSRIVIEAVNGIEEYLDSKYLEVGAQAIHEKASIAEVLAQYSESYSPTLLPLTDTKIRKLYQDEVVQISKPGTYMGLWQFFQAANVINAMIVSHYPEKSNKAIRLDVNRKFNPRNSSGKSAHILWTTLAWNARGRPSHFVPLLPVCMPKAVEIVASPISGKQSSILLLLHNFTVDNRLVLHTVAKWLHMDNIEPGQHWLR